MSSSSDPTRRTVILTALATAAGAAACTPAAADDDQPGSEERPQKADVLVFAEGEHAGEVIKPEDVKLNGPPLRAWPKDPKTSVVRKGSRLNEVLIIRLDPAELDDETRARYRWRRRLFGHLHPRRMSDHRLGEGGHGRQERFQMFLPRFRI